MSVEELFFHLRLFLPRYGDVEVHLEVEGHTYVLRHVVARNGTSLVLQGGAPQTEVTDDLLGLPKEDV